MRSWRAARFSLLAVFGMIVLLLAPQSAHAATITVSNSCSLANAIRSANGDSATGGCTAGSGADTINFTGTVTLSAALPAITSDITIAGGTIDGNDLYRPFEVNAGGHLRLSNVTVTKGSALGGLDGGAITVSSTGALTLTNATVSNSAVATEGEGGGGAGGGIYYGGSGGLTISNSAISGNQGQSGGGIYVDGTGTVTITSSVISGNTVSSRGGGVYVANGASLTISRSAIHGNRINVSGITVGIAIHNLGTLTVENSSLYDNDTTQTTVGFYSAIVNDGSMTLTHITLLDSAANGISNASGKTLQLRNSIIAGSVGVDCSGTLTSNVGNLIDDNTCSPSLSGSPQLASTATGSPPYFLPNSGSKVIGAAASAHCTSVDQRGTTRPQGNGCDIGAVEVVSPTAAFTISSQVGLTVTFDSSTSSAAGGNALTYSWDFGDGNSSTSANPSHTYASAGSYSVTLTVSNNVGSDTSPAQSVTVVAGPSASFTVSKNGLTANFDSSASTGASLTYSWTFGDGSTSTSANPSHTYASAGTYSVTLAVSNSNGSDSDTQSVRVDTAPNASFTFVATRLQVVFDSTPSTGSSLNYQWDFGDGGSSTSANPTHVYASAGEYQVELTVSNNEGSNSVTQTVLVFIPQRRRVVRSTASASTWIPTPTPIRVPVHSCEELNADGSGVSVWAQYGLTSGIQCQRRELDSVHVIQAPNIEAVINAGIRDVIEIWGFTGQSWEICFDNGRLGASGGIMFIEKKSDLSIIARVAPSATKAGNQTCLALHNKAGYVVAVGNAPYISQAPPRLANDMRLHDCMVRTNFILNLRETPDGPVIMHIPYDVTLTAFQRADGWIKVDYHGERGWLSAGHVTEIGACG